VSEVRPPPSFFYNPFKRLLFAPQLFPVKAQRLLQIKVPGVLLSFLESPRTSPLLPLVSQTLFCTVLLTFTLKRGPPTLGFPIGFFLNKACLMVPTPFFAGLPGALYAFLGKFPSFFDSPSPLLDSPKTKILGLAPWFLWARFVFTNIPGWFVFRRLLFFVPGGPQLCPFNSQVIDNMVSPFCSSTRPMKRWFLFFIPLFKRLSLAYSL